MSLVKFLDIIDKSFIGKFFDKKFDIISRTDPDRIFVENVRSFYNIPTKMAQWVCDLAVHEGIFRKKYAVTCPNLECRRIVASYDKKEDIPEYMECEICESLERENVRFKTDESNIIEFYQLSDNATE